MTTINGNLAGTGRSRRRIVESREDRALARQARSEPTANNPTTTIQLAGYHVVAASAGSERRCDLGRGNTIGSHIDRPLEGGCLHLISRVQRIISARRYGCNEQKGGHGVYEYGDLCSHILISDTAQTRQRGEEAGGKGGKRLRLGERRCDWKENTCKKDHFFFLWQMLYMTIPWELLYTGDESSV